MYDFKYHRAGSGKQAGAVLAAAGEEARPLAGGMTLVPTLKQRLAAPSDLVDLADCAELRGIQVKGAVLTIGAMTTHATVAASPEVAAFAPALAALAAGIGDNQVRNRGTIGGSVANNDPAADYPAACLALNATIVTDRREIPADAFFKGLFETALQQGELITAIRFPKPDAANYQKFPNPASRYALVGVMVARTGGKVRVAVTGAGQNGVFRVSAMENRLMAGFVVKNAVADGIAETDLISDIHAQADYRLHLIGVMAARAVAACAQ